MASPSCWNVKDRSPLLDVTQGLRLKYHGKGDNDKDAGAVRSNVRIPPSCGLFYFEIMVTQRDLAGAGSFMGIGVCGQTASMTRLPGLEKVSWGYHADTGNAHACSNAGVPYGPSYTTGDVVGCGVDFFDDTCFFTKNGTNLGTAFHNLTSGELYACVGLHTAGEVEANFGQKPFQFDIASHRVEVQRAARAMVEAEVLPTMWQSTLNQLVTSYLVHQGYHETAQTFARDAQTTIDEPAESICARQTITSHVMSGDIDAALQAVQAAFPGVLEANPQLYFRLRTRKFVELVGAREGPANPEDGSLEAVLAFGQELLAMCDDPMYTSAANRKAMQDAFSLIAYADPRQGPMAYLLDAEQRAPLADELNAALLSSANLPARPALETMLQQTEACLQELRQRQVGAAAFLSTAEL